VKPVAYWRTAWKRNSVRAHFLGFAVSFVGGVWAALPNAFVDRLPTWLIFVVPCVISVAGLLGAYTKQSSLDDTPNVDAR
jgi:hypothetical protein